MVLCWSQWGSGEKGGGGAPPPPPSRFTSPCSLGRPGQSGDLATPPEPSQNVAEKRFSINDSRSLDPPRSLISGTRSASNMKPPCRKKVKQSNHCSLLLYLNKYSATVLDHT
ncbi:uncharacterized [Lates japonicus]